MTTTTSSSTSFEEKDGESRSVRMSVACVGSPLSLALTHVGRLAPAPPVADTPWPDTPISIQIPQSTSRTSQNTNTTTSSAQTSSTAVATTTSISVLVSFTLIDERDIDVDNTQLPAALVNADAVILLYDVCDRLTFFSMPELLDSMRGLAIPKALLGCNMGEPNSIRQVDQRLGTKLASVYDVVFIEIGAAPRTQRAGLLRACEILCTAVVEKRKRRARRRLHQIQAAAAAAAAAAFTTAGGGGSGNNDNVSTSTSVPLPIQASTKPQQPLTSTPSTNLKRSNNTLNTNTLVSTTNTAADSRHDPLKAQLKTMRRLSAKLQKLHAYGDHVSGSLIHVPQSSMVNQTQQQQQQQQLRGNDLENYGLNHVSMDSESMNATLATAASASAESTAPPVYYSQHHDAHCVSAKSNMSTASTSVDAADDMRVTNTTTTKHNTSFTGGHTVPLIKRGSDVPSRRSSTAPCHMSFTSTNSEQSMCHEGYTVNDMIDLITSADTHDVELCKIFLMVYPKFLQPSELLDRLMDRFDSYSVQECIGVPTVSTTSSLHGDHDDDVGIPAVQLRVCNVMIRWMTMYWQDFHTYQSRFTLFVFLEVLASRSGYGVIAHRFGDALVSCLSRDGRECGEFPDWGVVERCEGDVDVPLIEIVDAVGVSGCRDGGDDGLASVSGLSVNRPTQSTQSVSAPHSPQSRQAIPRRQASILKRGHTKSASASSIISGLVVGSGSSQPGTVTSQSMLSEPSSTSTSTTTATAASRLGLGFLQSVPQPVIHHRRNRSGEHPLSPIAIVRSLFENESDAIAQQLCLMEWDLFARIRPRDLLHHLWSKSAKTKFSPRLSQSVNQFNRISSWVVSSILAENDAKTRAKIMAKFMRIGQWLRAYNNYNSLMAVIAGINNSSIARLKQTKQLVSDKQGHAEFTDLETLMSSEKSFARYRFVIKHSATPCIPYLGVFLRDLLYMDEANKDYHDDGSLHLHKFVLMGDVVLMIGNFQLRPYDARRNPFMIDQIKSFPIMDEETAYQRSLALEPRET